MTPRWKWFSVLCCCCPGRAFYLLLQTEQLMIRCYHLFECECVLLCWLLFLVSNYLNPVVSCAEYGGLGLDFSYSVAVAEELGHIRCGGVPMAIGVQSDMATPALARYSCTVVQCTQCIRTPRPLWTAFCECWHDTRTKHRLSPKSISVIFPKVKYLIWRFRLLECQCMLFICATTKYIHLLNKNMFIFFYHLT